MLPRAWTGRLMGASCLRTGVFGCDCSSSHSSAADGEGGALPRQSRGPNSPVGSNRSPARNIRSARVSGPRSAGPGAAERANRTHASTCSVAGKVQRLRTWNRSPAGRNTVCAASWLGRSERSSASHYYRRSPTRAPAAIASRTRPNAMDRYVLAEHNGRRRRGGEHRGSPR